MELTSVSLFIWMGFTILIFLLGVVNYLAFTNLDTNIGELRQAELLSDWTTLPYTSFWELIKEHLPSLLLLSVIVVEISSLIFPEVRDRLMKNKAIGSGIYLFPLVVLIIIMIVMRKKTEKKKKSK